MPLEVTRRDARLAGLSGLIDYAGLFPPESLDMAGAVAGYREALEGDHAWLVDRYICPVSRLEELAGHLMASLRSGDAPWRLVAVADDRSDDWLSAVDADAARVRGFEVVMSGGAVVEVVERRVAADGVRPDDIAAASRSFGRFVSYEVPWSDPDLERSLRSLASAREASGRSLGAKIRTGGVTEDAFPPPEAVAGFLIACRDLGLPLKATAGLHHPVRHRDAATGFVHHGFLNLLAAAAFAIDGAALDEVTAVLADDDAAAFALIPAGLTWRDRRAGVDALTAARSSLLRAYGSCSVREPVDDLTALGVLPVEP
ncbi:MAG TPA: hypothetical protein VMM81_03775 [Acidimicrobiia bacterium]|nr:hypothetical protein [Acidimicrobiia bacterium]